ncbi:SusC/RagA family TonB-linked outer membrane protein [Mucilaginibacter flavidus]|uniref:SusC/RagA family TonB-linked outer membrane protein n=1 Tax=Mucilaginibacter flavidus TaxID=2949309 RepID=UPI002092F5A6|nr:TonB-dependent receptor [Mucilaginibacter flavidus]MCO5945330.1 TonB-dependent receptor [Mucilaginibacter flavidus]
MKRIFTISGLVLLCFLFVNAAIAQNVTVKGKVTDASTGEALIGVSVAVAGTSSGTQTDVNGAFSLSAPSNATLRVSYLGYTTAQVAVNGQTSIDIKLQPSANELAQVVVVGYGTQRKLDVTGSVSTVKGEEISKQSSTNAVSALQGKVAGLQITNSGSPGSSPQVTIRGLGTIFGNTGVLYVVDGVWYDDISFINPSDIDNISVLKDASSTSIYGLRAANGVILVTTKRGKKGDTRVTYDGYAGWQTITNQVKMANANQYATLINEQYNVSGTTPLLFPDPAKYGTGTDWYGQILRDAFKMNHNVSVSGGTEKSNYNFSLGFLDQDGLVKNNNYKRYTARFVNDYNPIKGLKLGYTVGGVFSQSKDIDGGIFHQLFGAAPVLPVYYADGSYGDPSDFNLGGGNNYNPQATLDFYNHNSKNYGFTGNAYAEVKFLKHLTFKTSFGGEIAQAEATGYTPVYKATLLQANTVSVLSIGRTDTRNWIAENTLTYDNTFGDHKITVLAGQTAQRYKTYFINASAQNVPNSSAGDHYLTLGDVNGRNVSDGGSLTTALSYFGRVNYSFKDRYLLNASIRADAGSQFFGSNLWAYLPSVGAGWVISNEDFMKDQKLFSSLKLRGSWGKVGNAGVPINPTTLTVSQDPGYTAIFGSDQHANTGASVVSVVPPAILVERGVGADVGIEGSLLNDHLTFEADYYNRTTQNAIFGINIPSSVGTASGAIIANQADIVNKGLEFSVGYRGQASHDFTYAFNANFSINTNKVTKVISGKNPIYSGGNGIANGALATRTVEGEPIGEFFGYKVAGIFQNQSQITGSAQPNARPGDFMYTDLNNDHVIDGKDRVDLGNPTPKYAYGFTTNLGYKHFDLLVALQGVAGVSVYNANTAYRFGNENYTQDFYNNRWHGEGTSTTYPSAAVGSTANAAPNSFFVESGAYFRIRTAQLGYTVPSAFLSKWKIQKIRIFANAENPLNVFKYKGFSPEVGGSPTNAGIDANVYPLSATYTFGVNVSF